MAKSAVPRKKRGRPATTGKGQPQLVRMHAHQIKAVDNWKDKEGIASRPEAIRQLVELGLKTK